MSFEKLFRCRMNEALKNGDKRARAVYSEAVNVLDKKAKDLRVDCLTEEQELEALGKLAKQIQESIDTCPKDRTETLEKLYYEKEVITSYLPRQFTAEEIDKIFDAVLEELKITAPTPKDKGVIMKNIMPKVKGKADGKVVNQLLEKRFV